MSKELDEVKVRITLNALEALVEKYELPKVEAFDFFTAKIKEGFDKEFEKLKA